MKDLTLTRREVAARPECGGEVSGYESNRGMKQQVTPVEMWPGGPVWNDPGKQVIMEPDGPWVTTLSPCGHRVSRIIEKPDGGVEWVRKP